MVRKKEGANQCSHCGVTIHHIAIVQPAVNGYFIYRTVIDIVCMIVAFNNSSDVRASINYSYRVIIYINDSYSGGYSFY